MSWKQMLIDTYRGVFEVFSKGEGDPICVTHHYSEFNKTGDYFAETFTNTQKVYLVNLREAGNSEKANESYHLSMLETIFDVEAIRDALGIEKGVCWSLYWRNVRNCLGNLLFKKFKV